MKLIRKTLLALMLLALPIFGAGGYPETVVIEPSVTVSINAYATGDLIGSKLSLTSTSLRTQGYGIIKAITIGDLGKQGGNIDVVFFDGDPSNTTFTDNAALDIHDTDVPNIIDTVSVTKDFDFNDNSISSKSGLNIPFRIDTGETFYCALVSRGSPDYVAATDLSLKITIEIQ